MQAVWVRATGHTNTWVTETFVSLKNKISVCCALRRMSKLLPTSRMAHRPIRSRPIGSSRFLWEQAGFWWVSLGKCAMDERVLSPSSQRAPLWHSGRNVAAAAGCTCVHHLRHLPSPRRHLHQRLLASAMALDTGHNGWPV